MKNNDKILKMIAQRLEKGAIKYQSQVPINGSRNNLEEALEEVLDLSVYLSAVLLELREEYEVKYQKAYDILMEYFDNIPEEHKFTVHRKLKELKLWVMRL